MTNLTGIAWNEIPSNEIQGKINELLASCIEDVEKLGIKVGNISPNIRLTNNRRSLGICKLNRTGNVKTFSISISRKVFVNEQWLLETMYHEILHTVPGCFNHSAAWKVRAAKVSEAYGVVISRLSDLSRYEESNREFDENGAEVIELGNVPNSMRKFDRENIKKLLVTMEKHVAAINAEHNTNLRIGTCKYTDTKLSIKLEGGLDNRPVIMKAAINLLNQ